MPDEIPQDYPHDHVVRRPQDARAVEDVYHLAADDEPEKPKCGSNLTLNGRDWEVRLLTHLDSGRLCKRCNPDVTIESASNDGYARKLRTGDLDPEDILS